MSKHSKYRFPMPVYVATLASGEVVRISFGSPVGKPLDVARGRRCAAYQCGEDGHHHEDVVLVPLVLSSWNLTGGKYDDLELPDDWDSWNDNIGGSFCPLTKDVRPCFERTWTGQWRPLPPKIPATIVKGHVEYNGELYDDDTARDVVTVWPIGEAPKKAKAGPTLAECRAALQQIVAMGNAPNPPPPGAIARYAAAVLGIEIEEAQKLRMVA